MLEARGLRCARALTLHECNLFLRCLYLCNVLQDAGGMMIADGSRRRTPGGVFFLLLKERVSREQYKSIFSHVAAQHTAAVNSRRKRAVAFRAMSMGHAPPEYSYSGFEGREGRGK